MGNSLNHEISLPSQILEQPSHKLVNLFTESNNTLLVFDDIKDKQLKENIFSVLSFNPVANFQQLKLMSAVFSHLKRIQNTNNHKLFYSNTLSTKKPKLKKNEEHYQSFTNLPNENNKTKVDDDKYTKYKRQKRNKKLNQQTKIERSDQNMLKSINSQPDLKDVRIIINNIDLEQPLHRFVKHNVQSSIFGNCSLENKKKINGNNVAVAVDNLKKTDSNLRKFAKTELPKQSNFLILIKSVLANSALRRKKLCDNNCQYQSNLDNIKLPDGFKKTYCLKKSNNVKLSDNSNRRYNKIVAENEICVNRCNNTVMPNTRRSWSDIRPIDLKPPRYVSRLCKNNLQTDMPIVAKETPKILKSSNYRSDLNAVPDNLTPILLLSGSDTHFSRALNEELKLAENDKHVEKMQKSNDKSANKEVLEEIINSKLAIPSPTLKTQSLNRRNSAFVEIKRNQTLSTKLQNQSVSQCVDQSEKTIASKQQWPINGSKIFHPNALDITAPNLKASNESLKPSVMIVPKMESGSGIPKKQWPINGVRSSLPLPLSALPPEMKQEINFNKSSVTNQKCYIAQEHTGSAARMHNSQAPITRTISERSLAQQKRSCIPQPIEKYDATKINRIKSIDQNKTLKLNPKKPIFRTSSCTEVWRQRILENRDPNMAYCLDVFIGTDIKYLQSILHAKNRLIAMGTFCKIRIMMNEVHFDNSGVRKRRIRIESQLRDDLIKCMDELNSLFPELMVWNNSVVQF